MGSTRRVGVAATAAAALLVLQDVPHLVWSLGNLGRDLPTDADGSWQGDAALWSQPAWWLAVAAFGLTLAFLAGRPGPRLRQVLLPASAATGAYLAVGWVVFLSLAGTGGFAGFVTYLPVYVMLSFAGFYNGLVALALAVAASAAAGRWTSAPAAPPLPVR